MDTGTRMQALRNDTEIAESTPEIVYMLNKYANIISVDKGSKNSSQHRSWSGWFWLWLDHLFAKLTFSHTGMCIVSS